MKLVCLVGLVVVSCAAPTEAYWASWVAGEAPTYADRSLDPLPNGQAVTRVLWVPGLDHGTVPQGLTIAQGKLLLATYQSASPRLARGPCRVFVLEPATGAVEDFFDLPDDCGHAGGIAVTDDGRALVADTHRLFVIDLRQTRADGLGRAVVIKRLRLEPQVRGSFIAYRGGQVYIGRYATRNPPSLFTFPLSAVDRLHDRAELRPEHALARVPLPRFVQGVSFDRAGDLWLSMSTPPLGWLARLDLRTGEILGRFAVARGIEGLAFDADGRLWSVSERGALRFPRGPFYPVIFCLDVARLR